MIPPFRRRRERGFTLVELLVAMSVFLVVAGVLVSVANSTSDAWQQGVAHNERRSAAMAVFERMSQDLRNAAQPTDLSGPNLQMVITNANGPGPHLVSGSFTLPYAVFFQAPVTTGTTGNQGDLAEVGYFVQWVKDQIPNTNPTQYTNTPKLCRLLINPSSTAYTVYSGTTWSSSIDDALLSGINGAPADRLNGYQGQLAENVLGLWVQALDQTKQPVLSGTLQPVTTDASGTAFPLGQFDSSKGYTSHSPYLSSGTSVIIYPGKPSITGSTAWAAGNGSLPAAIEVAIVTVDSRTALRLTGNEKPPSAPTGNLWADVGNFYNSLPLFIKRGAEIHSTVIHLTNAP